MTEAKITEEAADWVLRLEEEESSNDHDEFVAWLKRSPRHMDEFLMVEASYRAIQQNYPRQRATLEKLLSAASTNVVEFKPTAASLTENSAARAAALEPGRNRRRFAGWFAAAVAGAAGVLLISSHLFEPRGYRTAIGEQRAFKLPDGSLLNLNTQSRVELDFTATERRVRLLQGEAMFTVKQDAHRPFRVVTDTALVQAIGTSFNVYRRPDASTFVSVVEGRVNVSTLANEKVPIVNAQPLPLKAGEEADVSKLAGVVRRVEPAVDVTVAWRQRRLVFRGAPLQEVIEQFNRYNADMELRVTGEKIGQRRITGTFDADEPAAFVRFLAADRSVRLRQEDGTTTIDSGDEVNLRPETKFGE